MGKVKVTLYGALARIVGESVASVEAGTLREALDDLTRRYGDEFRSRIFDGDERLRRFINVYVNGKDIRFLESLDTRLNDGDGVSIIPAVGGG
ncbi:MAG: ubiquitin-like small modifier protein 1 [Candidatus Freyarchaeota archaeon]